jgi:pimeloyl-ACP methyl ester carboxylesterase
MEQQADPARGAALVQQDLDFFVAHARDARLATFPGADHSVDLDQPVAFLRAFEEFVGGLA